MFARIRQALQGDSFPERLAAYEAAWEQGHEDKAWMDQGLITQFGAEYTDPESQEGYLDAVEGRYKPPKV